MRRIGVVTVSRSDFGVYQPILKRLRAATELSLELYVSGRHLAPEFGHTVDEIEAEGFRVLDRIDMLVSSDSAVGLSKSIGMGTIGFAQSFARSRPDILLVMGDRFEMFAAALAAVPFNMAIAHVHGGEQTGGRMDQVFRHSLTKMSHLHFVSNKVAADRVTQLGEEPWRITVTGAPGLDNLEDLELYSCEDLSERLNLELPSPPILVTYHPAAGDPGQTRLELTALIDVLESIGRPVVWTYPNADEKGRMIIQEIEAASMRCSHISTVKNLGTRTYFSLMKAAAVMVGNSSSGILEAASIELPVVNIGTRQQGRTRARNVLDVGADAAETTPLRDQIQRALNTVMTPTFRAGLTGLENPFGDGTASDRIVERLAGVALNHKLLNKRFHDL